MLNFVLVPTHIVIIMHQEEKPEVKSLEIFNITVTCVLKNPVSVNMYLNEKTKRTKKKILHKHASQKEPINEIT